MTEVGTSKARQHLKSKVTAPTISRHQGLWFLIAILFAISGTAALIHQVIWTRWLTLSLGSSTRATVLVLAAFMAGMGLGSWMAGRIADRNPRRTLALFAGAEALIGIWALLSIPLLGRLLPAGAAFLARHFEAEVLPLPLRATLALISLVLPTLMMGATVPLLARWTIEVGGLPGRGVGILYSLNTLGGAAGALLAPFVLVEILGLSGSAIVAATSNLVVAGISGLFAARSGRAQRSSGPPARPTVVPTGAYDPIPAPLLAAGVGFFASGFVGLALEVVSHRVMAVLAGSSVYAFSVMLGAFLIGIAGGSAAALWHADRTRLPGAYLGLGLVGLALGIGCARRLFTTGMWQWASPTNDPSGDPGFWSYRFELGVLLLILLPATFMLGFVVPMVARLTSAASGRFAGRFGMAYALNTFGAVLGAAAAGSLLVPRYGTATTLGILTVVALLAGLLVLAIATPRRVRLLLLAVSIVLGALGIGLGTGTNPIRRCLLERARGGKVLDFREGPVQAIAVIQEDNDQQLDFLRLVTNQTSLTGTHLYARRYMKLLGHLPAVWGAPPRRAFVICLGTGMTAAAVAAHPGLEQLDIAEISPAVVGVAPFFREVNLGVLEDPRVRLHVEDGRHILLASDEPWDLITLEPPPPRDSGVVSLYSLDFYELCLRRLTPTGVVAQWIPLHSQSLAEVRMLVRSFLEAFPHTLGFLPVERELLLLGSGQSLAVDPATFRARLSGEQVRASLAEIGLDNPAALLATALFDRAGLARFATKAPMVTDDRPRVEYFARHGRRPALPATDSLISNPLSLDDLVTAEVDAAFRERFDRARAALRANLESAWAFERRLPEKGNHLLMRSIQMRPDDPYYQWSAGLSDGHLHRLAQRARSSPDGPSGWQQLGRALRQRGKASEAVTAYRRALALAPDDVSVLLPLGVILMETREGKAEGRALLQRALRIAPHDPRTDVIRQILTAE